MTRRGKAVLLFVLGLVLHPAASDATCSTNPAPELAAEAPDVVLSPAIRQQAAALEFDAVRIYEFVRNGFDYEVYFGLMRGPEATLRARRGNEYDLAALLVSLLRVSEDTDGNCILVPSEDANGNGSLDPGEDSDGDGELDLGEDLDNDGVIDGGTPARFARGRILVPQAAALNWMGVANGTALVEFVKVAEPTAWRNAGLGISTDGTNVEKLHVWVEAEVPIARYRGSGPGDSGTAWLALDPSFKQKELQPGIVLPLGASESLEFDVMSYLSQVQQELPLEWRKREIRDYLAANQPGMALSDVPVDGPIVRSAPGVLPNALPYALKNAAIVARDASLVPLHTHPSPGLSPHSLAGETGADDYRWALEIRSCAHPSSGLCLTPSATATYDLATIDGKQVVLSYPPVSPSTLNEKGYTECWAATQTQPTLTVDAMAAGFGPPVALCAEQDVVLTVIAPLAIGLNVAVTDFWAKYTRVIAGGYYSVALDTGSGTPAATAKAGEELVRLREVHRLELDEANGDQPYLETDGQPGKGSGESYFLADFAAQDALTGGLLHLAGRHYMQGIRDAYWEAAALHHEVTQHIPWVGLVESAPVVSVFLDAPFMLRPQHLLIDIRGSFPANHDRATGAPLTWTSSAFTTVGWEGSAREHLVWEELTNFEGISTVKALQVQAERGQAPLSVTSQADAFAKMGCYAPPVNPYFCYTGPSATVCTYDIVEDHNFLSNSSGYTCPSLDTEAYCRIRANHAQPSSVLFTLRYCPAAGFAWPNGVPYCSPGEFYTGFPVPRGFWHALDWDRSICQPFSPRAEAIAETIVPRVAAISYQSFWGTAYFEKGVTGGVDFQTFAIRPYNQHSLGGGYPLYYFDTSLGHLFDPYGASYDFSWSKALDFTSTDPFEYNLRRFIDAPVSLGGAWAGDPVNVFTGNYYQSDVDIQIAGPGGHGIRMVRSYNSKLDYDGPLGFGWVHTYDQHLRFEPEDQNDPNDIDRVVWVSESGGETPFDLQSNGTLTADGWVQETLEQTGTGGPYVVTTKHGMKYHFYALDQNNRASLDRIVDRNGNAVTAIYGDPAYPGRLTQVQDGAGRQLVIAYDANDRIDTVSDWAGRTWDYDVVVGTGGEGDLVQYRDAQKVASSSQGVVFSYYNDLPTEALNHNIRRITQPEDRDGDGDADKWIEFVYYASDAVQSHTNALGETTAFFYDYFRRRTTVTNPDGTEESYLYDTAGNITRYESAEGIVREYAFQPDTHNRLSEWDGLGFETSASWDANGNMKSRTDRTRQHTESWDYDPTYSLPTRHTDRRGNQRQWSYDAGGNLLEERALVNGQMRVLHRHEYDHSGNRTRTTTFPKEDGTAPRATTFQYASNGVDLVRQVDAAGHETLFQVDAVGRVVATRATRTVHGETVPELIEVTTVYDEIDRPVEVVDPVGTTAKTIYDANGNVEARLTWAFDPADPTPPPDLQTCIIRASCRVDARNGYDAEDRLASVQNALGDTTTIDYNARGWPIRVTTPLGHSTRFAYDADGRLIETEDPTGAMTARIYDAEGRVVRELDALGRETTTTYDEEGRVLEVRGPAGSIDPLGIRLAKVESYDPEGNPTRIADATDVFTDVVYDELGRRQQTILASGEPLATTTDFVYDLEGRLLEKTAQRTATASSTTKLTYDVLGRLVRTEDPQGRLTRLGYDEVGNRTLSISAAGDRIRYAYDPRGLLVHRASEAPSPATIDDTYAYDGFGRRVVEQNGGSTREYTYDDLDRIAAVYDPDFGTIRRVFDADGRMTMLVYPDGTAVSYGYTPRGEVATIRDPAVLAAGNASDGWELGYDAIGRPTEQRDPFGVTRTVRYLEEGFVDRVELRSPYGLSEDFAYSGYDVLGNPGSIDSGEGETQVQYDRLSRVVRAAYADAPITPCGTGCERFEYDLAGNRTLHELDGVTRQYLIDDADQLTEIQDAGGATLETFDYDGAGRRTQRTAGGQATTYTYDPLGRLAGYSSPGYGMVLGYTAAGHRRQRLGSDGIAKYFGEWLEERGGETLRLVHGPGVDDVIAEITSAGAVRTATRDGTANVTHVSVDGVPEAGERRYRAFGEVRSGSSVVERGFAGRPTEGGSGLVYLRARHYDPETGRFLQADPLGVEADQLYAYGAGNPYRFGDPTGLVPWVLGEYAQSLSSATDGALAYQHQSTAFEPAPIPAGAVSYWLDQLNELDPLADSRMLLIQQHGQGLETTTLAQWRGGCGPSKVCLDSRGSNLGGGVGAGPPPGSTAYRPGAGFGGVRVPSTTRGAQRLLPANATPPRARGTPNRGPHQGTIYVDKAGNAIPTPPGGRVTGSPDGRWIQARDAAGNPTGVRIDGPHKPASHPDPRAQAPHGHVPGVANPDGTQWLPIRRQP